jgi:hypothetical protein
MQIYTFIQEDSYPHSQKSTKSKKPKAKLRASEKESETEERLSKMTTTKISRVAENQ